MADPDAIVSSDWLRASFGGDAYSEAITIVVTLENGSLKVRDIEFGRP